MATKDFDRWNAYKKALDGKSQAVNFHEREIWWCAVGVNIGSEQDSYADDFGRPVIVLKKFTDKVFWGVPLTTKIKTGDYRIKFSLNDITNDMLILQARTFDTKRLINKVSTLSITEYTTLTANIIDMLIKSTRTPESGVPEAEARVFTKIDCRSPYTRSIEEQRLLSSFFGDRYWYRLMIASRP
ncbi:MAG: type II toxin-antitoxin system PemK/MazF family toxin [Patescibacteria group bacterium]|nr:type II toxin-antitoxin system PemK/MazF family toxin [Patescibacteria group bacterium]